MKKLIVAAAAGLALTFAGVAQAKEISEVKVCGAEACKTITDRAQLDQFAEGPGSTDLYVGAAAPADFYTVRVTVSVENSESVSWEQFYVPSARVMRGTDESGRASWRRTPNAERAALDAFASGVKPFPAPEVTRATVGRRVAADPASYLGLYRLKLSPKAYPKRNYWIRIRLSSAAPSPWTDGANVLRYSPKERLLERDGDYVRLPKRLARDVASASALHLSSGGGSKPVGLLALIGVLPLAAAGFALRRRRTK
jgi:hypothetical protein